MDFGHPCLGVGKGVGFVLGGGPGVGVDGVNLSLLRRILSISLETAFGGGGAWEVLFELRGGVGLGLSDIGLKKFVDVTPLRADSSSSAIAFGSGISVLVF